ncbi:MAG: TIGR03790 family protein [Planctomycetia bacterium]|nr:TIGR03790 family protein [Planctomycetia bacterium]
MVHRRFPCRLCLAVLLIVLTGARFARAGGGPENVFVVVNAASWASQAVANHFIQLRQIPPVNVFYINWTGGFESIEGETLRKNILVPALDAIDKRGLLNQIDYIVYSSDFPYSIDFNRDFVGARFPEQIPPECSLNSATYLWNLVLAKNPILVDLHINHYMRSFTNRKTSAPTHGFHSWYGWGNQGELIEAGGQPYMLSTVLAITSGRGNSVREAIAYLRSSASADGTFPKGTIYFDSTDNVRTQKRAYHFATAIDDLKKLAVAGEVVRADVPTGRDDVMGAMTGVQEIFWGRTRNKILSGAICENFTSFGGKMVEGSSQTPLSEFLRYGAAASSGTINEPFALAEKFPTADIHVHYARGCSLAEAYYQSVFDPAQLLIVGDPLCRPWANIPKVYIRGVKPNAKISGTLTIKPSGKFPKPSKIERFELFVDGRRAAAAKDGESLEWDSTGEVDGYHELRVVGVEEGPIETQGRTVFPVFVDNHGRSAQMSILPEKTVRWGETLKVHVKAPEMAEIYLLHNGRLLAKIDGEEGDVNLNPQVFGTGPVTLHAVGIVPSNPRDRVIAAPVQLVVEAGKPLAPLKDVPDKLAPGLVLKLPDNKVVPVQETLDPNWLTSAGLESDQPFLLQGYFEIPTDDVYQFQVWHDGDVKLSVNGSVLYDVKHGNQSQRFIAIALAAGQHRLTVSGRTGNDAKLRILFGGPGALSLSGKDFRHAR